MEHTSLILLEATLSAGRVSNNVNIPMYQFIINKIFSWNIATVCTFKYLSVFFKFNTIHLGVVAFILLNT